MDGISVHFVAASLAILRGALTERTWFWAFGHYPAMTFERDGLLRKLARLANERGWPRISQTTLKNDVACFVSHLCFTATVRESRAR